jgi:hypothetical protein
MRQLAYLSARDRKSYADYVMSLFIYQTRPARPVTTAISSANIRLSVSPRITRPHRRAGFAYISPQGLGFLEENWFEEWFCVFVVFVFLNYF